MSRTEKDWPNWVRSEYAVPYHFCSLYGRSWQKLNSDCNLLEDPPPKNYKNYTWFGQKFNMARNCFWEMEWPKNPQEHRARYRKHKREWRRREFHGPQRMKSRLASREVIKGDHYHEFPDGRGRHSVLWDMW